MATISDLQTSLSLAKVALTNALNAVTGAQGALAQAAEVAGELAAPPPPPPPAPTPSGPSADGATATPGSGSLTDKAGNVWAITAAGVITLNGSPAGSQPITDGITVLWWKGVIYGEHATGIWNHWYSYWGFQGSDPRGPSTPAPPPTPTPTPPAPTPSKPTAATLAAGNTVPATGMAAVVTISGGAQYVFSESHGTATGAYVGPVVTQSCINDFNAAASLSAEFGTDTAGPNAGRKELILRLGTFAPGFFLNTSQPVPAVTALPPFQVDIYQGGKAVDSDSVPYLPWWGEYTWPWTAAAATRAIARQPAALVAGKFCFPLNPAKAFGAATPVPYTMGGPVGIFDAASDSNTGLQCAESGVGGRPEIGPFTAWMGDWLMHQTPSSLETVRSQALVMASAPFNYVDRRPGKGAILSVFDVQSTIINLAAEGEPTVHVIPMSPQVTGQYLPDSAHMPNVAAAAAMIFDDPRALRTLQAQASYSLLWTQQFSNIAPGIVTTNEDRAWGWSAEKLALAYMLSPPQATCPSWLLPKEYWKQCLDANLTYVQQYMASPATAHTYWRAFPMASQYVAWQRPFDIHSLSLMTSLLGLTEWRPFYEWLAAGYVAFAQGNALGIEADAWGKGVEFIVPYFVNITKSVGVAPDGTVTNPDGVPGGLTVGLLTPTTPDYARWQGQAYTSRQQCWDDFISTAPGNPAPDVYTAGNPNLDMPQALDPFPWDGSRMQSYVSNLGYQHEEFGRGAHALMAYCGIAGAAETYAAIEAAFPIYRARWGQGTTGDGCAPQWAFDVAA